jgi:hypothetical protein
MSIASQVEHKTWPRFSHPSKFPKTPKKGTPMDHRRKPMWLTAGSLWEPGPWQGEDKEMVSSLPLQHDAEQKPCQAVELNNFILVSNS